MVCFSLSLSCNGLFGLPGLGWLSQVREVFYYNLLKYFLIPFLFSCSSGMPIVLMLVCLMLSQRSLRLLISFYIFSLSCSASVISTTLSSSSLIHSSISNSLLLVASSVLLLSAIVLCIADYLFFNSSRSSSKISCSFLIHASILFPRFWIIFPIIIQFIFMSTSYLLLFLLLVCLFACFRGFLSCSFTCRIFLCLLILFRLLCFMCPFCRLEFHGSS